MSLQTKRLIVFVASLVGGAAISALIIFVGFGTTLEKFAFSNVFILFISFFCIIGIWLDYFLGAQILKN